MSEHRRIRFLLAMSSLALLLPVPSAYAACEEWAAQVFSVQGSVEGFRTDGGKWEAVRLNDTFCAGDKIRTLADGRADLKLASSAVMKLSKNSAITLQQARQKGNSMVDMIKGAAHLFSRKPESLEIKTPYAIAGVRGTEFLVEVGDETLISVFQGAVLAQNDAGSVSLGSGQSAVAQAGKAPELRVIVRPRDAVSWALYYPPLIAPSGGAGSDSSVLDAQKMLSTGRVEEAQATLEQVLKANPDQPEANALLSVVAVAKNDKDAALALAERAVAAKPDSSAAQLALSYARQARFDLEGALQSAQATVRADENSALAWARLAEVQAMFGNLSDSLASARKASALDPGLSRAQTVLGFAKLQLQKTGEARQAFEKAIATDPGDPMPRLGMGLAMIRDGKLEEGGGEIEMAASLDPGNSLIRSYLGKVYYEEKRSRLDEREFAIAKELDPNDPTPWFYEAISLDSRNRPIDALHAYQKSIELNDNRAVYRSGLLLDSDEAARSAGIARIYGELGFQQRALAEGWNAVGLDPTDYSAHRFLADSYAALPRHEIARVSELLQSQLLQPLNLSTFVPSLAETSQMMTSSMAASSVTYNEFTPLIAGRNRGSFLLNGLVGEHNTVVGEGAISAIGDSVSVSAGFSHSQTDGWRDNADQNGDLGSLFAQWEITSDTSVQAEFRHKEWEQGDIAQNFFPDVYWPGRRDDYSSDLYRLGIRQAIAPGAVLLGSYMHQTVDTRVHIDASFEGGSQTADFPEDLKSDGLELQGRARSRYADLIVGYGYANIDHTLRTSVVTTLDGDPPFVDTFDTEESLDLEESNAHAYAMLKPLESLAFTVGLSADFANGDNKSMDDRREWNPKAGVTWNLLKGTTLRGAVFRVMERSLIAGQTLEPTQVAGFNQFFYDSNGANSWRYGVGVDQKFSGGLFAGVEVSRRRLETFGIDPTTGETASSDHKEKLCRAYAYWTPLSMLALAAEYQIERFEDEAGATSEYYDPDLDEMVSIYLGRFKFTSQRLPLSVKFFHPTGLSASVTATYYAQEGDFQDATGFFANGEEKFWLVDASVRYLFPQQRGSLSVGAKNLFKRDFQYFDIDENTRSIQPDRTIYGLLSLHF